MLQSPQWLAGNDKAKSSSAAAAANSGAFWCDVNNIWQSDNSKQAPSGKQL